MTSLPDQSSGKGMTVSTLIVGLVGVGLTVATLYQAFVGLPAHMPEGAFTIYDAPTTPGANPMKLYHSYRVFYLHLPSALSTMMVSMVIAASGALYLLSKKRAWENLIVATTQIGVLSCLLAMATGYFWGDFAWGQGWNMSDPRLNATLILWLSFLALLAIRGGIENPQKRAMITAVYALLTVPLYPFAKYSIEIFGPEWTNHPLDVGDLDGSGLVGSAKRLAIPAVMALYAFFLLIRFQQLQLSQRINDARRKLEELEESQA